MQRRRLLLDKSGSAAMAPRILGYMLISKGCINERPTSRNQEAADPLEQWRNCGTLTSTFGPRHRRSRKLRSVCQASGAMLETFLTTSAPFRDAQKKTMVSALEQCNMPSRDDFVRLADRLANLELLAGRHGREAESDSPTASSAAPQTSPARAHSRRNHGQHLFASAPSRRPRRIRPRPRPPQVSATQKCSQNYEKGG